MMRRMGRPGLLGLAARTAVVAGTATAVSGGMRQRQMARAEEQQAEYQQPQNEQPAPAPAAAPAVDLTAELQKLADLHSQGILDDAEFASAKAKLLAS